MPFDSVSEAFSFGVAGAIVGVLLGFVAMESGSRDRIAVILQSLRRRRRKRRQRPYGDVRYDDDTQTLRGTLAANERRQVIVDPTGLEASRALAEFFTHKYQGSVDRVYLFGSRARGDFCPESDVDVAVILPPGIRPFTRMYWTLVLRSFLILIRQGAYVQPRLLTVDTWQTSSYFSVLQREGFRVWPPLAQGTPSVDKDRATNTFELYT